MGIRFRKSFKIAPGIRTTVSRRGISHSVGVKGLRVSRSKRGTRLTASAPGTGLSYQTKLGGRKRAKPNRRRWWLLWLK